WDATGGGLDVGLVRWRKKLDQSCFAVVARVDQKKFRAIRTQMLRRGGSGTHGKRHRPVLFRTAPACESWPRLSRSFAAPDGGAPPRPQGGVADRPSNVPRSSASLHNVHPSPPVPRGPRARCRRSGMARLLSERVNAHGAQRAPLACTE